ncbi:hypothetical protein [Actinomadura sp. CNU-125]|uniref:hypothetical protein n=1 Tax=Actinomadura sp. CNU-125 TaxID=1904961 RepID=UPI00096AA99F|nr:hypothetical protein [Actinomadura sp. CNU-125]
MTEYTMTDQQLASIEHTYTTGYGSYVQVHTQQGLTREEWNDLSDYQQRNYYYDYGPGVNAGQPDDPSNALPRSNQPDRSEWKVEAKDGYDAIIRNCAR